MKETHKYDDIIHLPHPVSPRRSGMTVHDRAAQFSPFAALTGYEDVIAESGRLTDMQSELTDSAIEQINEKLRSLAEAEEPVITVRYFMPDRHKAGGAYVTAKGTLKRIDTYAQVLVLTDGRKIPLEAICDLQRDS